MTNQGVEVSLNVNKQFGKDLFVSLMGTFTYAHNEITERMNLVQWLVLTVLKQDIR